MDEDPNEVDVSVEDMVRVMGTRKHRLLLTEESDTMDNKHQYIKNTDGTINGLHSDVTESYAASPVKQYSDYRSAVIYGTGRESGLKTVTPRNLRPSTYQRTGKSSRQNKVMHGTGSGTGLRAVPHKTLSPRAKSKEHPSSINIKCSMVI